LKKEKTRKREKRVENHSVQYVLYNWGEPLLKKGTTERVEVAELLFSDLVRKKPSLK
jgi:hypothetical protein